MKHNVENGTLTIYLEGDVNSYNADEVEMEIDKILSDNSFKRIVLDLEHLHYVSSAGIRIIIRIKQQYDDLTLLKTPKQVFDVFQMVGLNSVVKIEKL